MAYDYSSDNKRLELPNPFRVENSFLFACALVTLVGGVTGLMWARDAIDSHDKRLGVAPLLVGVALLAASVSFAVIAARRLRFFFGRGRPRPKKKRSRRAAITANDRPAASSATPTSSGAMPRRVEWAWIAARAHSSPVRPPRIVMAAQANRNVFSTRNGLGSSSRLLSEL